MPDKTYVAKRDRLKVMDGFVHTGEAFPAGDVTNALLTVGWVGEGAGGLPTDEGSHSGFSEAELAGLGKAPKAKPAAKAPKAKADEE
jgi:hypothetical protein